jgi:hypothetical protein
MLRHARVAVYAAVLIGLATIPAVRGAAAAVMVFPNRIAFANALSSDPLFATSVENWDSYPSCTLFPSGCTLFPNGSTVAGITYNVTNGTAYASGTGVPLTPPNDLFTTAGTAFRPLVDTYSFGFDHISPAGINAFGITFSSTFANHNGDFFMKTSNGDVIPSFFDPLFPGFPLGGFVGMISDQPFVSVTIGSTANALYGLDNLTFAIRRSFPVPEPGTVWLFAAGALAAGLWRLADRR